MSKNIALVLSGGGARGYAHIGVIKVLQQQGYSITSISGTSMGALIGGIYAAGRLPQFEEWILSLDLMEVLKLTDFSISKKGLVKGKRIIERIKQIVPDQNIEELPIPFCAVATDILNGTEVLITRGNLYDAIRASISIPTVFQPLKIDDHYYVDGGILNPIPVNRVFRHEGDLLVVVNVSAPIPYEKLIIKNEGITKRKHLKYLRLVQEKIDYSIPTKKNDDIGIFNLTNRSISLMMQKISELTLEKHQPDIMINISKESFSMYDFYKAKDIIAEGENAARKTLAEL